MLPHIAIVLLSALTASAGPIGKRCGPHPPAPGTPPTSGGPQDPSGAGPQPVVTPALPSNGGKLLCFTTTNYARSDSFYLGARELAGAGSLALKQVLLGHGIQNYTCSAAGQKATATGALAVLWDIKGLYPGSGPRGLAPEDWDALTVNVLHNTDLPLNLANDAAHPYAADTSAPFPAAADLTVEGVEGPMKFAGHHYFAGAVPTFDISATAEKISFSGKKDDGIPAPAAADKGITGSGAVDWLQLGTNGASSGASMVYRVFTAGGVAAACTEAGQTDSVPYTAQYWFYG